MDPELENELFEDDEDREELGMIDRMNRNYEVKIANVERMTVVDLAKMNSDMRNDKIRRRKEIKLKKANIGSPIVLDAHGNLTRPPRPFLHQDPNKYGHMRHQVDPRKQEDIERENELNKEILRISDLLKTK